MINWRMRTAEVMAMSHPEFTPAEKTAAAMWATCAVGEQHAMLPEVVLYHRLAVTGRKGPEDLTLLSLGSDFGLAVLTGDAKWAWRVLDKIDERILEMKRETRS